LIEPALNFGKGFQDWVRDRRQKDDAKRETKKSPKKQKIEVQDEKPTSSEILADQFVVEKPDERSSLEKLQQDQPDKRSILEKLQDEYEKEKRLEEKKEEARRKEERLYFPELKTQREERERNPYYLTRRDDATQQRRLEDEAKQQLENERMRREALMDLDEMSLPSVKASSQENLSVTMESVDEEFEDDVRVKPESVVEPVEMTKEESEHSDPDKTTPWDRAAFPGLGNEADDSGEIRFRPQDSELNSAELAAEVHYVDMPAEDIYGPNYCKNILITKGDLFESVEALGHAISADIHMGAGIAYDFRREFGGIQELFMQRILPGGVAILERDVEIDGEWRKRFIYNLVTKTRYHDKPELYVLLGCLYEMRKHARDHGLTMICLPRIGAGLDQLKWADVYAALNEVFGNTEIYIRIFFLPRQVKVLEPDNENREALWDQGLWHCEGKSQVLLQLILWD
jgi:O-acetyl-ADP-ribose deacetylase (regulator of RNase III)